MKTQVNTTKKNSKNNAFNKVNQAVLKGLKEEGLQWFKPWRMADGTLYAPLNYTSRRNYTGVNRMLLSAIARAENYSSGEWATYKAISEAGGHVKKGEKGTGIVFWNRSFRVTETGKYFPNERAVIKAGYKLPQDVQNKTLTECWSLIYHTVFNIEQADGIETKVDDTPQNPEHVAIPSADDIYNNYNKAPQLRHGGNQAYYSPSIDKVQMPNPENFVDTASYYKTLFHELIHSTGHKNRLKREGVTSPKASFGNELYSKEELVAEIGAWYLTGICGLEPKDSDLNSQAYINGWIKHLENKEREAVYAMGQAQKAVEHIIGKGGDKTPSKPKAKKQAVLNSKQVNVKPQNITIQDVVEATKETAPNYFEESTLRFFNQTVDSFSVDHVGGNIYIIHAPSYWDDNLMGYSVRLFDLDTGKLLDTGLNSQEIEDIDDAIEEVQYRYAEGNLPFQVEERLHSRTFTVNGKVYDYDNDKMAIAELSDSANVSGKQGLEAIKKSWNEQTKNHAYLEMRDNIFQRILRQLQSEITKEVYFDRVELKQGKETANYIIYYTVGSEEYKSYIAVELELVKIYTSNTPEGRYSQGYDIEPNKTYEFGLSTKIENYATTGSTFQVFAGNVIEQDTKEQEEKRLKTELRVKAYKLFEKVINKSIPVVNEDWEMLDAYVDLTLTYQASWKLRRNLERLAREISEKKNEDFFNNFLENGATIDDNNFVTDHYWIENKVKGCSDTLPRVREQYGRIITFRIDNWSEKKAKAKLITKFETTKDGYGYEEGKQNFWEEDYNCDREGLKKFIISCKKATDKKVEESKKENNEK